MQIDTEALFALLDFCGMRQRDVAQYLGVSKALVSQWRSGRREMGLKEYSALLVSTHERRFAALQARIANFTADTPLDERTALLQELDAFRTLYNRAWILRSPALLCEILTTTIGLLSQTIAQTPDPRGWDSATLEQLTKYTEVIVNMARMLRSMVSAEPGLFEIQAQTEARLGEMARALQEAS